jgi:hypothetical protein
MKRIALLSFFVLAAASACIPKTEFNGAAHFPGGAQACYASCNAQNMEMSGFVYSGEFASSCVCRPRPQAAATSQADPSAADVAALAGVVMQTRDSQASANAAAAAPAGGHK